METQTVCGISVVDGDWEKLKRFNIAELYPKPAESATAPTDNAEIKT
jgi:tRNA acetyltransferase TAN1